MANNSLVGLIKEINLEDGRVASKLKRKTDLMLFTQAVFTHPVDADFYVFNHARERTLHGLQVDVQAPGVQAFQVAAIFTVKMGMGRMIWVGRQAVDK